MDRRRFIKLGGMGGIGIVTLGSSALTAACNHENDGTLVLGSGFTSRVIARTNERVGSTGYNWHTDPDGGACFPVSGGGWIYVSNSESIAGGASMVRFSTTGEIVEANRILGGTIANCAGGATPWGTWLSCEEHDLGLVWECDPSGATAAQARPNMGRFAHEAAAADPVGKAVYLTEDKPDGAFYRFRPTTWGNLSAGALEVLTQSGATLTWKPVPDPSAGAGTTRSQVAGTKVFNGGEGTVYSGGSVFFTTKGDNKVWKYTPSSNQLTVLYDKATSPNPVLSGVDNITADAGGNLYVAEDGGDMQIIRLTPAGTASVIVQLNGVTDSEITGPAFSPDGTRLYFSSQRNPGVTYEVRGPF